MLIGGFSAGWLVHGWKDTASEEKTTIAQQQVTIAAENNVIVKQQKSEAITDKTEVDYEKDIALIDTNYDSSLQPATNPTSNSLPVASKTPSVTRPIACTRASKTYKLTFEQCDKVQAGFNALWYDWVEQAK